MSDVLFVHNNFPGQFGFIARTLAMRGDRVASIGSETSPGLPGVPLLKWKVSRGSGKDIYPPATRAEVDILRGRAAAECALRLREQGFDPALIIGHPGWGETLFMKEVWPKAKVILHGEFFYRSHGADVGFDREFETMTFDDQVRVHAKNVGMALAYAEADHIVSPTPFQASVLPPPFRALSTVIHEGVDTGFVRPIPDGTFALEDGRTLDRSRPVVTFINRHFEPLRGFHIFMRALPALLDAVPEAEVILIGSGERRGYGLSEPDGQGWKARMLAELGDRLDLSRLHFVGHVPHERMRQAFSVSAAHVYFTYPFVLSWSLLEAMASECLVIGSDTAPVRDAITNGVNGVLSDFFDVEALSAHLIDACRTPERFTPLRKAARETVIARYDRDSLCRPAWVALVDRALGRA